MASLHILGFLCIDSQNTYEENDCKFKQAIEIAIVTGKMLYPIFENILNREIIKASM